MSLKKVVVAADSFKGSLSSGQVAAAVAAGVRGVFPACEVHKVIIADGGEGTVDALVSTMRGEYVDASVHDPLMRPVTARYGVVDGGRTAVIEMASASGLPLLSASERNPLETTTYGTGEMILDAFRRGCRRFLVGIGGSATNDAGTGMLRALGFRFLDGEGRELQGCGASLASIEFIDASGAAGIVSEARFTVACDVTNPLVGPDGAAYVFAPQKGATPEMVAELDRGLRHFAEVVRRFNAIDIADYPGAGAAGGLGGAFKALLGAELVSGIRMVLDAAHFDALLEGCDLVITGEGRLDEQTPFGKAPAGVLEAARSHGVPVIAVGGSVSGSGALNREGFAAVFPIQSGVSTLAEAMEPANASANITRTVSQVMNLLKNFGI